MARMSGRDDCLSGDERRLMGLLQVNDLLLFKPRCVQLSRHTGGAHGRLCAAVIMAPPIGMIGNELSAAAERNGEWSCSSRCTFDCFVSTDTFVSDSLHDHNRYPLQPTDRRRMKRRPGGP